MRAARRRRVSTLICSRSTTTEVRTTETSTITYALPPGAHPRLMRDDQRHHFFLLD